MGGRLGVIALLSGCSMLHRLGRAEARGRIRARSMLDVLAMLGDESRSQLLQVFTELGRDLFPDEFFGGFLV